MTPEELIVNYPVLHHMAEAGSWPAIQSAGLRTTTQLVDDCNPTPDLRAEILERRRAKSYDLLHPSLGTVTVRDQGPLKLHNLVPALRDSTVEEFLRLLNSHVFMWAHPGRLEGLLGAKLYREQTHDVLILDTARVVEACQDRIRLTGMNTGATIFPNAPRRGADSFMTITAFPFAERARTKAVRDNVVEVCVLDGIDNLDGLVRRVERRHGPDVLDVLFEA